MRAKRYTIEEEIALPEAENFLNSHYFFPESAMSIKPLITTEEVHHITDRPVLIIDKKGILAEVLIEKLQHECSVVVVSSQQPQVEKKENIEHVLYVPFTKRIPAIPEAVYSLIIVIQNDIDEVGEFLPQIIQKAKDDVVKCIITIPLEESRDSFLKSLEASYRGVEVIVVGEVFGGRVEFDRSIALHRLFLEAIRKGKIVVLNTGMRRSYPVFIEDVAMGILEVAFGSKKGRVFFLFPKHPPTELSLARMLAKVNPLLAIDFVKTDKEPHPYQLPQIAGEYLLDDNYWLDQRIRQLHEMLPENIQEVSRPGDKSPFRLVDVPFVEKKKKKKGLPVIQSIVFALILFLLLPSISVAAGTGIGVWQLFGAKDDLLSGYLTEAGNKARVAQASFGIARVVMPMLSQQARLLGQGERVEQLSQTIDTAQEVASVTSASVSAAEGFISVMKGESKDSEKTFRQSMANAQTALQFVEKQRANGLSNPYMDQVGEVINEYKPLITLAGSTATIAPDLFGFSGKKTYLILFQNNMELRPTGGFIGSYSILTLDQGKVNSFTIHDVYDADGQLKGHIEPPYPLRRYLPSVHWFLRDSNFSPDFPTAASSAAYFLQQETKQDVDGVIAADVSFVQSLVEALGPLQLPAYNETITGENFYLLTQTHAEKDFFPGSTQKKDILRSVFTAMQEKLAQEKHLPYAVLGKAVAAALEEKHILFSFENPQVQKIFTINGFSAALWDEREGNEQHIQDFLAVSEANVGVNKANFFIKRKIKQEMAIDGEGSISGRLTLYYQNDSKKDTWPGGDYKNYLRVLLPQGAQLTGIQFDGKPQAITAAVTDPSIYERQGFTPPTALEVEQTEVQEKTAFGFLVIVPAGAFRSVTVSYVLAQKASVTSETLSYDLRVFKQPGTENDQYEFSLHYPLAMKVYEATTGVTDAGGRAMFTGKLSKDLKLHIDLSQQ